MPRRCILCCCPATGLNPKTERIIEIGAARVEDGIVVQTYSTFVNPERELDARIRELTGICDDDLKDARSSASSLHWKENEADHTGNNSR